MPSARRKVYIDTETLDLNPVRRQPWDIAMVAQDDNGELEILQLFIATQDLDLSGANDMSLRIGRFHQRHPQLQLEAGQAVVSEGVGDPHGLPDVEPGQLPGGVYRERHAAHLVERFTRDAVLYGVVPSFDMDALFRMMARSNVAPSWHYQPFDVTVLATGWLYGRASAGLPMPDPMPAASQELSEAIGVETPGADERHTALGDALWAMRIDNAILNSAHATPVLNKAS